MKKLYTIFGILTGLFLGVGLSVQAATILYPIGGGTGTSTAPTYGQILVGNAGGTYTLTATSSLGISSGSTGTISTSSPLTAGQSIYATGWNTVAGVATSTPITTYPLQISGTGALIGSATTFSLAFGTTTSNTWAGTQTFTNVPIVSSLSGLIAGNTGTLYQTATSTLAVGSSLSSSGTLGYQVGGTNTTLSLNMANANSWTGLQSFANASSSLLSNSDTLWVNRICYPSGECADTPNIAGSNIQFFKYNEAMDDISGYESLYSYPPVNGTETDESCTADTDTDAGYCLIDPYVSTSTDRTLTGFPAGTFIVDGWGYVDNASGNSYVVARLYKRIADGTETLFAEGTSTDLTTSLSSYRILISVTDQTWNTNGTDRFVVKYYGYHDSANGKVIHTVYGSSAHFGMVRTTATIANLGYAHLFSNQTFTGTNTFSGKVTLGNASTTLLTVSGNTWLGTLDGLIGGNSGFLYQVSTSTLNIGGNAATATKLATARTINGVSFDGTANIVVASTTLLADVNTWAGLQSFANASTTVFSSGYASSTLGYFGTLYIPSIGTAAGTFLAADASGKIIATSTPAGGSASTTLLADINTWTNLQSFNRATTSQLTITGGNNSVALTIGSTTDALTSTTLVQFANQDGLNSDWSLKVAAGGYGTINFGKSEGTLASPATTTNPVGSIDGYGYADGAFKQITSIIFDRSAVFGVADYPSKIDFKAITTGTELSTLLSLGSTITLGSFSGLIAGNAGTLYQTASSTLYGTGTAGQVLMWSGTAPKWAATSTAITSLVAGTGINGGTITSTGNISLISYIATSSAEVQGNLAYWTTSGGTPAKLGIVATSTVTCGLGLSCTGLKNVGSAVTFSIATSSLYTGTTGQFPYFSNTNTLTATSSTFLSTMGYFGVGSSTPTHLLSVGSNYYVDGTGKLVATDAKLGYTGVISPTRNISFTLATSTAWAGTTTGVYIAQRIIPFNGTIRTAQCKTDAGTLWLDIYHTTTHLVLISASTTMGTTTFSTNNTVSAGELLYASAGTPATSPTRVDCTLRMTEDL